MQSAAKEPKFSMEIKIGRFTRFLMPQQGIKITFFKEAHQLNIPVKFEGNWSRGLEDDVQKKKFPNFVILPLFLCHLTAMFF